MADPENQLSAQERMYETIARKTADKNKPLVLTNRILKPAEKRVLKKLTTKIKDIKFYLNEEREYRSLNPEDNFGVQSPTLKQKQESLKREESLRMQLKTTNKMISKVKAGALIPKSLFNATASLRGGGGGLSGLTAAMQKYNELF